MSRSDGSNPDLPGRKKGSPPVGDEEFPELDDILAESGWEEPTAVPEDVPAASVPPSGAAPAVALAADPLPPPLDEPPGLDDLGLEPPAPDEVDVPTAPVEIDAMEELSAPVEAASTAEVVDEDDDGAADAPGHRDGGGGRGHTAVANEPTILEDHDLFRRESAALVRSREWQQLAGMIGAAIDGATWLTTPETRAALLRDLAGIYRDRLGDAPAAEDVFRRLLEVDPAHSEAIAFLDERYRERKDWRALYDVLAASVEPTLDPKLRLERTREMVAIASERLRSIDLVIDAWERLFRLGDAQEEAEAQLSRIYRTERRWDGLADFLLRQAQHRTGAERAVALREVAEALLVGSRDHEHAAQVLGELRRDRPNDALALLGLGRVLARRKDFEGLAELARRLLPERDPALVDVLRLIADALWTAGELERAMAAYDAILRLAPEDAEALKAREEFLTRNGRTEELVGLLAERAARLPAGEARVALLVRAASLADAELGAPARAIALWERVLEEAPGKLEALDALAALYESVGEMAGLARVLEAQLAETRDVPTRIELNRRLGAHAAHRLGDDARAEACWNRVLAIVPGDPATVEELVALYRRRGDHEGLDRTYARQSWRLTSDAALLALWRAAAENVEQHLGDPARATRAWWRVVDFAPEDAAALAALVRHARAQGDPKAVAAALEDELRAVADGPARRERTLEVALLWEQAGDRAAALAAHERVLRWDPTSAGALDGLARLLGAEGAGVVAGALDVAAAAWADRQDDAGRLAVLRRAADLVPASDPLGRFFALRRVLRLGGPEPALVREIERAAEAAQAWTDLAALYVDLAAGADDRAVRADFQRRLGSVYETKLGDPVRALLAIEAIGRERLEEPDDVAALERLYEATGRHEDHLALLELSATVDATTSARRAALRKRAAICEGKLGDAERAFHEQARLLLLDPGDRDALAAARRLAGARGLWRQLDALLAELWDRARGVAERLELARARHEIHAQHLSDRRRALDLLVVAHRLDGARELEDRLLAEAEALGAWDHVLAAVEGRIRARGAEASPEELAAHAARHERHRQDAARALELVAEAVVLAPGEEAHLGELERLAAATGRHERLAAAMRLAAARAPSPVRALEILPRLADVYAARLGRGGEAIDVHRRILQLDPSRRPSLDAVIEHQRAERMWHELRDSVQKRLDASRDEGVPERVARLLEIARLSRQELGDPERALAVYAEVLELDPESAEAIEGVRALTEGRADPALELRRARLELRRATGPRRVELLLRCAAIQREQLGDEEAAIATLRELVAETAADGPGYAPLAALLRARKDVAGLLDLMEARAAASATPEATAAALEEALAVCEAQPQAAPAERRERLYRRLLDARPGDEAVARRVLGLYRGLGRFDDLALLLGTLLATPAPARTDAEARRLEDELIRVLALGLGRLDDARALIEARLEDGHDAESDGEDLLALASLALRAGDFPRHLALRERHARGLPPALASLVFCHLAEACADRAVESARVAHYLREARTLDPANAVATDALKAIGRRVKNWRATAALLPDADQEKLSWPERAARLCARGRDAAAADPDGAMGWFQRAIAVDPDCYAAWDGIAQLYVTTGDAPARYAAERAALAAYERAVAPAPASLREHAARVQRVAEAAGAVGDDDAARRLSRHAYELARTLAPAALAVAEEHLLLGRDAEALSVLDRLLHEDSAAELSPAERLRATFRRGALLARLGRMDDAITDLRAALRLDPLHSGALEALADVLARRGRVAAAAQHCVQALLVTTDATRRGVLYARLGRLFEEQLGAPDEALACYELAFAAGADDLGSRGGEPGEGAADTPRRLEADRDMLLRMRRLYRRQGRPERALGVIEQLLPSTTDPMELAALWAERGDILAATDPDRATEAFDMALSYDPGNDAYLGALARLLEQRGEWMQLVELYESRADTGSRAERAAAHRALARIARERLRDADRAARALQQAVALAPEAQDFDRLLDLVGEDPGRHEERCDIVAAQLATTGPWLARTIELGKQLVARGERRAAWSLLSPVLVLAGPDAALRATLQELRKEFEKLDDLSLLGPDTHARVRPASVDPTLYEIVAELDEAVALGATDAEGIAAKNVARVDARQNAGKVWAAVAERLGLGSVVLARATAASSPMIVLDVEPGQVVLRTDVLQFLPGPETNFHYVHLVELSRPGTRVVASLSPADRPRLVPALLAATGIADEPPEVAALAARIRDGAPAERLSAWGARLGRLERGLLEDPDLGARYADGVLETARRVGLVAAGDVRAIARVLARIDESAPKLPAVGQPADLEGFLGASAAVRGLLGFAASRAFAAVVGGKV